MPERATQFFGRPFQVIALHGFADALLSQLRDSELAAFPLIGNIDQWSDNTDLLEARNLASKVSQIYGLTETQPG